MKFVMVIANEEYQTQVEEMFRLLQCNATMIASTGDFLQYGEIIYLLGVDETQEAALIKLCENVFEEDKDLMVPRIRILTMRINRFIKSKGEVTTNDREKSGSSEFSTERSGE